MRLTVIAAVLAVAGLLVPAPGLACSCSLPGPPCQAFWTADAIFVGRVVAITDVRNTQPQLPDPRQPTPFLRQVRVTFLVRETLSGSLKTEQRVDVWTGYGDSDCGYRFTTNRDYVVYASRLQGRMELTTGICTRTRSLEQGAEDLAFGRQLATASREGGRIYGKIRHFERGDDDNPSLNVPAPDVTVTVSKDGWESSVSTNAEGLFEFGGLATGTYAVQILPTAGFYAENHFALPVELRDVRGCVAIERVIQYDGRISGRLLGADLAPLNGATLHALRAGERDAGTSSYKLVARTSHDGTFEFEHLPIGMYRVAANADADFNGRTLLPRVFHPGVSRAEEATVVELGGGQRVTLQDFVLPPDSKMVTVTGVVKRADGSPAPTAKVYVKVPWDRGLSRTIGTTIEPDRNGTFVVSLPAVRRFTIVAELFVPGQAFERSDELPVDTSAPVPAIALTLKALPR